MSVMDSRALDLLGLASRGCKLDPGMRLIGLCLLCWSVDWDREALAPDEIADMVSMTPMQVLGYLERMLVLGLVEPRADGWVLTLPKFNEFTRKHWYGRHRPVTNVGSASSKKPGV